ncbi:MAG TPA: pitrilysin family protein, partial [Candidatus Obscuribacterales bacterium]
SALLAGSCFMTFGAANALQATAAADNDAGKQSPPPAQPPRPLQLPKPTTYKMTNGMTVVMLEDHRVPFVTFQLGIKSGDSCDPTTMPGLASVTADMLSEGTSTRTGKEIATEIDRIGGAVRAQTDPDFTIVAGSGLSKHSDSLFGIAADMTQHPNFPEREFKLEKTNLLQELTMKRTNPGFLANERFHKVVFGNHPYATISPTPESVEKMTRQDLVNFHNTHYLPNLATLVVVGDFHTDKLKNLIDKDFGGWTSEQAPSMVSASCPQLSCRTICLVDRPGSVQSTVKIGNLGITKNDPDYFAVMVANQILGGSANSRLFLNIREQKGYTYGAYSQFAPHIEPGYFTAGAEVRTPVTAPALKEFLYELGRIRTTPVSTSELTNAKNYLIGTFQSGFETQANISQRLLEQHLYNLPADYLQTYTDKVEAVQPEDVKRVANKDIDFDHLAITVVGDAKQIETDLRSFGPVEVYDQSGKLVRHDDAEKKTL